ncbi:MAG: hypothetical protein WCQ69_02455 [Bacteroidales bacterium]|jgi:magnesium-transporting ATPase (P-type)|nr:hypothetical protein [Bacteroidales bacterium]MDD2263480.1 hypothetical protein [Bacteroidales bacterium]MDD2830730.1 hypothetical protein [Bacteroidales bacterium]MDD3207929.1 hypothetical protein [Bacteroidales bacterium]MDD3696564.1 hypothetical protein [Bacteroidales bacterium]
MKGFNIGVYLRRVLKYIIFYTILIMAMLAIVYFTSDHPSTTFWELIQPEQQKNLIILIVAFSVVYPFIGFSKKEIYTNRPMAEDKETVICIVGESGFILVSDQDGKMVFKAKRITMRIFRVFEDKITIKYNDNPLIIEGMRRDMQRIARHLELFFQQSQEK